MWYVYFLQLDNGDVYVGSTNDLRRRFESHQSGCVTSTKAHLPVVLKTYIAVETEANARQLERYFKTGSGKAFASKRFFADSARSRPLELSN
ncbi:GIY-YIG nuclease family protein [Mesorhizobium sp. B2-3-4]|uniref:GIY-YIG nuclease family protein n=1 Tax=Mesorhizobium sp. B2-3-4 TaxID=2589959 RepID=UPI00112C73B9|nr:GIY-YIG nuclease family protein [Mesorhizobium sp. B2-3-4]TPM37433.1 excinuclease ABC subunit C [Mesorhizobium sp. B2-3-4]